jgi:hypothetical protein
MADPLPNMDTDCLKVPIVGPDTPPAFNVKTDDGGCWVTECASNNCYNYGNDIVTNRFSFQTHAPVRDSLVAIRVVRLQLCAAGQGLWGEMDGEHMRRDQGCGGTRWAGVHQRHGRSAAAQGSAQRRTHCVDAHLAGH